jgi:hypothetical protein
MTGATKGHFRRPARATIAGKHRDIAQHLTVTDAYMTIMAMRFGTRLADLGFTDAVSSRAKSSLIMVRPADQDFAVGQNAPASGL